MSKITTDNKYGIELILDMHQCDKSRFTKADLRFFLAKLCDLIKMKPHGEPQFWTDSSDILHLNGISCFQFIETSNIVVHALTLLDAVYINIFSCKLFDTKTAKYFAKDFFKAKTVHAQVVDRI